VVPGSTGDHCHAGFYGYTVSQITAPLSANTVAASVTTADRMTPGDGTFVHTPPMSVRHQGVWNSGRDRLLRRCPG
jgi:hypothetical protein